MGDPNTDCFYFAIHAVCVCVCCNAKTVYDDATIKIYLSLNIINTNYSLKSP